MTDTTPPLSDSLWKPGREEAGSGVTLPSRFEIIREIGRGGFGVVVLAFDTLRGDTCAIKVLKGNALHELEGVRHYLSAGLDDSRLVPVREVGEHAGLNYIVMDLADNAKGTNADVRTGEYAPLSLAVYIKRCSKLDADEAAAVLLEPAHAIAEFHRAGLVHSDLKPDNIMRFNGHWCIGDYSVVSSADDRSARGGTPQYQPPGEAGTPEADTFALGLILHQMLTGAHTTRADAPDPPYTLPVADSAETQLRSLVRDALTLDARTRISASRFARRLEAISAKDVVSSERQSMLVTVVVAATVVVFGVAWWIAMPPPSAVISVIAMLGGAGCGLIAFQALRPGRGPSLKGVVVCAAVTLVCIPTYYVFWSTCTLQPDELDRWTRWLIGFHMQEWSWTQHVRETVEGGTLPMTPRAPIDLLYSFDGFEGQRSMLSIWTPWSVILAGSILFALKTTAFGVITMLTGYAVEAKGSRKG